MPEDESTDDNDNISPQLLPNVEHLGIVCFHAIKIVVKSAVTSNL